VAVFLDISPSETQNIGHAPTAHARIKCIHAKSYNRANLSRKFPFVFNKLPPVVAAQDQTQLAGSSLTT
jgi:hypothetical protein